MLEQALLDWKAKPHKIDWLLSWALYYLLPWFLTIRGNTKPEVAYASGFMDLTLRRLKDTALLLTWAKQKYYYLTVKKKKIFCGESPSITRRAAVQTKVGTLIIWLNGLAKAITVKYRDTYVFLRNIWVRKVLQKSKMWLHILKQQNACQ